MSQPANTNDLLEQAIAQHKAGRPAEAERLYRLVVQHEPRQALAQHNLGVVIVQRGNISESVAHFKAALDANPGEGLYWLSYARALLKSGQAPEALRVLEQAKARGLSGVPLEALMTDALAAAPPDDAAALFSLGNAQMAGGDYEKAIEFLPPRRSSEARFSRGAFPSGLGAFRNRTHRRGLHAFHATRRACLRQRRCAGRAEK